MAKTPIITRDTKAWELEIKGEVPPESFGEHRSHVIADLKKNAQLPGFRPGKAPEDAVVKAVGENEIIRRTIEHAVQHELPEILAKESALIIAAPKVIIESAPKTYPATEPVVFTARAPLAPEVKLPDYKKIAKKHNESKGEVTVTNEEHEETLTHLKRERARITKVELGLAAQEAHEAAQKMEVKDLPALDDEFVKSLGYESAEKFTEAVKGNLKTEKEMRETEKRRAMMLDDLIEKSTVSYPSMLLDYELEDMQSRLKQDLDNMRVTMERYLTETGKTEESLREEWKAPADKRAKMRLILSEIARSENIQPDQTRLENEMKQAKQHYPQADDASLRAHIQHALRNEAVITFLEQQ